MYRIAAPDIMKKIAVDFKHLPEEYNMFLHALNFRPASTLHRLDAIYYALNFIRWK
jgi:hypothetical protein